MALGVEGQDLWSGLAQLEPVGLKGLGHMSVELFGTSHCAAGHVVHPQGGKVIPVARAPKPQCPGTFHALPHTRLLRYVRLATASHVVKLGCKGGRDRLHFTTEGHAVCHLPE